MQHTDKTSWYPVAHVLLIEQRRCSCGRAFEVSNGTMVRLASTAPNFRTRLVARQYSPISIHELPQRVEHFTTHISSCQHCFTTTDSFPQLELFPRPRPPRPSWRDILQAKNAGATATATATANEKKEEIVPFTLNDF